METKEKRRPTGKNPAPGTAPRKRTAPPTGSAPVRKKTAAGGTATRKKPTSGSAPRKRAPRAPSPDVVYTQPGPFNRNRFLLQLASVVAVVLAMLFGMSIFFKVDTVTVSGVSKYTQWDVYEASGIRKGENLLTISKARLGSNIRSKLPYVDTVRIGIKLPGTVKVEITELDVVYAVEDDSGAWWLMRADGGIVEKISGADSQRYTKVLGVKITGAAVGEKAKAAQPVSEETLPGGETVPVTVNAVEQLDAAISILQYLEDNGIIGDAKCIDVTDTGNLEMWYGDRFQVLLGDTTQLSYKIKLIKSAVESEMETYDNGILDVSFRVKPDPDRNHDIIYTPFPEEG